MKKPQQIIYDSRDWKALEKKLSKMDSGPRGKVFEWFCVFYLQVESRHATTYKERFTPKIRKQLEKLGTNFEPTKIVGAFTYYD